MWTTHTVLSLLVAVTLMTALPGSAAAATSEEEVRYRSDVPLAAALLRPRGEGPWPAVVIVHGSGAVDRKQAWARAIAELFVARGFAVLLPDKRGSGGSGGDWRLAGFEELADDAIAGVEALKAKEDIDPRRIGVAGLSQGGWIVPLVAVRRPDVAFVVDLSGATVSLAEQTYLEMGNTARKAGLPEEGVRQVLALNRAAGRYLLGGAWDDYAAVRAAAMAGPAKPVAAGFPAERDAPIWTFLRKVGAWDPLPYWTAVEQPVFIGLGERDEEDNVPVAESVRRIEFAFSTAGKTNYDLVVAPAVGHALWNEKGEFAPLLLQRLDDWLAKYGTRGAGATSSTAPGATLPAGSPPRS